MKKIFIYLCLVLLFASSSLAANEKQAININLKKEKPFIMMLNFNKINLCLLVGKCGEINAR